MNKILSSYTKQNKENMGKKSISIVCTQKTKVHSATKKGKEFNKNRARIKDEKNGK